MADELRPRGSAKCGNELMSSKLPGGQHLPRLDRLLNSGGGCGDLVALEISYGLYVFHNLTVDGLVFAVRNLHAGAVILTGPGVRCLSLLVLTISAAAGGQPARASSAGDPGPIQAGRTDSG